MGIMAGRKSLLEGMFLYGKPAKILVCMKGARKYASIIAKEVDCTYSHTVRILQNMKKIGLVEFEKKGRIKNVGLTKLGEDIAGAIENLMRIFSKAD